MVEDLKRVTLVTNRDADSRAGARRWLYLPEVPRVGDTLRLYNPDPVLREVRSVIWDEKNRSVEVRVEP